MPKVLQGTALDPVITKYDRRLYAQDESNHIVEFIFADGKWSKAKQIVEAAPGTGFAAVWWDQLGIANSELDLYYVNQDFVLSEMCWRKEKGWWKGDLANKNWKLHPKSQVSAKVQQMKSHTSKDLRIMVVAQAEDDSIQAYTYRGEWKHAGDWNLGKGDPGTSITVTEHKYQNRIFYQIERSIVEMVPEDGGKWKTNKVKNYAAGPGLASWQAEMNKPRFFYTIIKDLGDDDSRFKGQHRAMVAEHCADGSGGWWTGNLSAKVYDHGRMGAVRDDSSGYVYVYFQRQPANVEICEWRGEKWEEISKIKT